MKKIAGLLIILVVLVLGGYFGMGVLTEKTIKKNIEVINQSNGIFAELEQYQRGFFNSTAKIQWRLHVPEHVVKDANGQSQIAPAQDYQMDMPVVIHHGPIIFADNRVMFGMGYAESVVPFPDQYKAQFDSLYTNDSKKPNMDLSIFVNYLNNSTLNINIPSFTLTTKEGNGQVVWKGIDSRTSITSNIDKVKGGFVIDGLDYTKDDSKLSLGKVSSDYDLHETPAGLYLGNATFSLPSFVITIKNQKMFEVADFSLSSDSDIENKLFSTHFNTSLKTLLINGQTYGPGDLELTLRNLDAEVLAKINEQATAMQNGSDADRQRAMLAMLPELPKLLSKGAEFEISQLRFKMPQGLINGTMLVSLPKGDTANPFELFQKIHGTAELTLPKEVVKQLMQQSALQQLTKQPDLQQAIVKQLQTSQPQLNQADLTPEQLASMQTEKQLAALEQSGLVVVKGTDYVVEMNLDQGKFTVNSKPFDPAAMKF
ncbi:MAG: YdgA family protein [Legionella sp.]